MDRYLRVSHLNIHQQSKKHTLNPTFALSMRFCAPFPWFIIEPILPDLSITKTNSPWVARDDITSSGNSGYKLIMTTGSLIREPEKERKSQIKSNQITFIVTSPQHKCLGEWNSYERAPDSAKKKKKKTQQQQFTYGQTVQKKQQQFTYGQYIFTDCTEDNVQNTHTYTQYT